MKSSIAKNILFLYMRMFFVLGISLYTSRVLLDVLGVDDFGLYNLIGSVIIFFSFINNAMTTSTQRFLNYEMGLNNIDKVNLIFSSSIYIHFFIALLVLILGFCFGPILINNYLTVGNTNLAQKIFAITLVTFCINIIKVPFNSLIIAYEKMSFFAYSSMIEAVLKLAILFLLLSFEAKLVIYCVFLLIIQLFVLLMMFLYKRFRIRDVKFVVRYDKSLIKSMMIFSMYSVLGNISNVALNSGVPVILNNFLGLTINAAIGLANQVNAGVYSFVSNIQVAFNPQIVKNYASNSFEELREKIFQSTKLSYYFIFLLSLPVLVFTDDILHLWLTNIPDFSIEIIQITIVCTLIETLSAPLWASINASGNIRKYQIFISIMLFLNIPIAYLLMWLGKPFMYVFYFRFIIYFLLFIFRIFYVLPKVKISIKDYFLNVMIRVFMVSTIVSIICYYYISYYNFGFFVNISIICLVNILTIILVGSNAAEKREAVEFVRNKMNNLFLK